jgi:hypothetical protein
MGKWHAWYARSNELGPQSKSVPHPMNGTLPEDPPPFALDCMHEHTAAGHEHVTLYVQPSLHDSLPMQSAPLVPLLPPLGPC